MYGSGHACGAAVLAVVDQIETGKVAVVEVVVDAHLVRLRTHRQRHRHVLEEGLVGGGAAQQEGRIEILALRPGVVVFDLVVVPGEGPGHRCVDVLQVAVGFVLGVTHAIAIQRVGLRTDMAAYQVVAPVALVDVVADEEHQVEIFIEQMPVRREVRLFVMLAGGHGEAQAVELAALGFRGTRAPDRADLVAAGEAIPVPAPRFEPVHVDMHAVRQFRHRAHAALAHDVGELVVARHFPAEMDHVRDHAAIRLQRLRGQARPQRHAVGAWIAGGDPERERVPGEARRFEAVGMRWFRQQRRGDAGGAECERGADHVAARRSRQARVQAVDQALGAVE